MLIETRKPVHRALFRDRISHIPVRDEIVAVGIDVDEKGDDIIQKAHGLFVGAAHHLVDHFA